MGTNKRYADKIDRAYERKIDGVVMREAPLSLTADELELDVEPLTRTPRAMSARAWIRYPLGAVLVDVEVVAWTERAVAVRWQTPEGQLHRAWVWRSAVRDR